MSLVQEKGDMDIINMVTKRTILGSSISIIILPSFKSNANAFFFCLIETSCQGTNQYARLFFQPDIIETIMWDKKLKLQKGTVRTLPLGLQMKISYSPQASTANSIEQQ